MKTKTLLIPFFLVLTLFIGLVSAGELAEHFRTEFNGVVMTPSTNVATFTSDTIPVKVTFTATKDARDVRVNVRVNGFREDVQTSSERFNLVEGITYTKLLNLHIPPRIRDRTHDLTLYVEIVDAVDRSEKTFSITVQRYSYELSILTVDYNTHVVAGDVLPISVVLKNTGFNRLDDNYVVATIPELGITSRNYAGDLIAVEDYIGYDNEEDSVHKLVYLEIPRNTPKGVYELFIEAYSYELDATTYTKRLVNVNELKVSEVIAPRKSKNVGFDKDSEYELVLINSGNQVEVFSIQVSSPRDLIVSAPSVEVVGPASSKTIQIFVRAADDAREGTHTFSVTVNGKQTVFSANVSEEEPTTAISPTIIGLTVVLVIIFVVLLAVLIILLSKKDSAAEEVETSYY